MTKESIYDKNCRACPRLAGFLDEVSRKYPGYFCKPVPPFGVSAPRLFVVGLAPGMHGANRTGRPFTGDYAGVLLYETLHAFGFATAATSESADDRLELIDCRISNAVKCLPPDNKPTTAEIRGCNHFLRTELGTMKPGTKVLALGLIAHNAILAALEMKLSAAKFAHGAMHPLPHGLTLFDSYHCSRYNTNTRRLTKESFHAVFEKIAPRVSG